MRHILVKCVCCDARLNQTKYNLAKIKPDDTYVIARPLGGLRDNRHDVAELLAALSQADPTKTLSIEVGLYSHEDCKAAEAQGITDHRHTLSVRKAEFLMHPKLRQYHITSVECFNLEMKRNRSFLWKPDRITWRKIPIETIPVV